MEMFLKHFNFKQANIFEKSIKHTFQLQKHTYTEKILGLNFFI